MLHPDALRCAPPAFACIAPEVLRSRSLAMALGGLQRIHHQHSTGHGPHSTGHGRDIRRFFCHSRVVHIAAEFAVFIPVHRHINDNSALLNHIGCHQPPFPHSCH